MIRRQACCWWTEPSVVLAVLRRQMVLGLMDTWAQHPFATSGFCP